MTPLLDELKIKKAERLKQFLDIRSQIDKMSGEIMRYSHSNDTPTSPISVEEHDLSLRKLSEYQTQLRALQKEKVCIRIICRSSSDIPKVLMLCVLN